MDVLQFRHSAIQHIPFPQTDSSQKAKTHQGNVNTKMQASQPNMCDHQTGSNSKSTPIN